MSDYRMNISGGINLSDYSYIHDYMGIIGSMDNFQIDMQDINEDDVKVLCSILESDKFDIIDRQQKDSGYSIFAIKRRWISLYKFI